TMTLAPRSWPSRPGFATSTRIGRVRLAVTFSSSPRSDHRHGPVLAVHGLEAVGDLPQRSVGAHRAQKVRHQVLPGACRLLQRVEGSAPLVLIALPAHACEALALALLPLGVHRQKRDVRRLLVAQRIDADHDLAALGYGLFVAVGAVGDAPLEVAVLDGGKHAPHFSNLIEDRL